MHASSSSISTRQLKNDSPLVICALIAIATDRCFILTCPQLGTFPENPINFWEGRRGCRSLLLLPTLAYLLFNIHDDCVELCPWKQRRKLPRGAQRGCSRGYPSFWEEKAGRTASLVSAWVEHQQNRKRNEQEMSKTAESPEQAVMREHSALDGSRRGEESARVPRRAYAARSPRKLAKWSGTPNKVNVGGGWLAPRVLRARRSSSGSR